MRAPGCNPLCRRVKGKGVDEVLTIKNSDIAKHLSLPPVKLHCSMLAEDAIKVGNRAHVFRAVGCSGVAPEQAGSAGLHRLWLGSREPCCLPSCPFPPAAPVQ